MSDESPDLRRFFRRSFGLLFGSGELNDRGDVSYFIEGTPFQVGNSSSVDVVGRAFVNHQDGTAAQVLEYQSLSQLAALLGLTSDKMQLVINRIREKISSK